MTLQKQLLNVVSGAVVGAGLALAQVPPTTVFQLNGHADNGNLACSSYAAACDYWNLLNGTGNSAAGGGVGANSSPGHSVVRTFINGTSSTYSFQGGGSKDSLPISGWSYAVTGSPNKDTINAAYAAAYQAGSDFELIFGADRLSANGDANIGIWFFQQNVATNGSGGFTGAHVDHDLFVISAFTNGGGTSLISVYEWDGSCNSGVKNPTPGQCADTNLRLLANPATVCGNSAYCAVTNSASTNSTWESTLLSPLFFEGGVDMTAAFAPVGITHLPCFSSFLVETRSSQSTTAVLKDFLAGGFPVCGLSITKACGTPAIDSTGTSVTFPVNGIVRNIGAGTLYNTTVYDALGATAATTTCTNPGCTKINVINNTAGSPYLNTQTLAPGETGTWSDRSTSTSSLSQSDVAIAKASTVSGATATLDVTSATPAFATCSTSISTSLSVTKSCSTSLNTSAQVVVGFSGQVCNNGPSQVTGITLTDFPSKTTGTTGTPVLSPGATITLAPSGQAGACASYSGSYIASTYDSISGDGTGAGRYFFNDLIAITGTPTAALGGALTALQTSVVDGRCVGTYGCAPATCPLCQSGECTP